MAELKKGRKLWDSRGQGMVEYILLVVVIIMMALMISARLFKPFNEWAKNYIGEYVYCLLDEGELPSLGGDESVEECNQGFEAFSVADGRPAREGAGEGEDPSGRSRLNRRDSGRSQAGDAVFAARRGRRGSALGEGFENASNGRGVPIDVGAAVQGGRRGGNRFFITPSQRSRGSDDRGFTYRGITGSMARQIERVRARENRITTVAKADLPGEFSRGGKKQLPFDPPRRRPTQDTDFGSLDFSFGEWMRYLLIIAIIAVLILFIVGQMNQISKSLEKSES